MTSPRVAVCLHGFLRTGLSMYPVRRRLQAEGYAEVVCPTWRYELSPLPELGRRAAALIQDLSARHGGVRVDAVTHSMGGLVVRSALTAAPPLGRVVMLAPPNQGAQLAARVRRVVPVHRVGWDPLGPLLPGKPSDLPLFPSDVDVGVLIGGTGAPRGFSRLVDGDNDGKVRVEEARLPGARDFRVVPYRHPLVMARRPVLDLVVRFLARAAF